MTCSIWQGSRVRLRGIEPTDWADLFAMDQDSESTRALYSVPFPVSRERQRRWTERAATAEVNTDEFRFAIENPAGELVGAISTHACDLRNGTFSYGIAVREGFQRQGYAAEAIQLVLRYFFRERRYQKVTVHVYGFNLPSIRLHEGLGFQREGRLRRMIYTGGQFHDEIIFGLTAEEFSAREVAGTPLPSGA